MKKIRPVREAARQEYPSTQEAGAGMSRRTLLLKSLGAAAAAVGGLALGCRGDTAGSKGSGTDPMGGSTDPMGMSTGGGMPAPPPPRPRPPQPPRPAGAIRRPDHPTRPRTHHTLTLRLRRPFGIPGCSTTFRRIVVITDSERTAKLLRSPAARIKIRQTLSKSLAGLKCRDRVALKGAVAKILTAHVRKRLGNSTPSVRVMQLR